MRERVLGGLALCIGGAVVTVRSHIADHHGCRGVASGRRQVGVADRTHEALGMEVEVQARDCDERWLGAEWSVAEGAREAGVCRSH